VTSEARGALDRSMVRAVAWGAGAKWASQVFTWVATIIVARLLHPYDYGLVGMAGIYVNLTTLISQIGIPDAIITLRDLTRRQIAELNAVALLLSVALVALSCGMAFPIARFFSAPPLRAVLIVASTTYLINAFQVVPRALLQKELRFKLLAAIETVRAIAQMLATLVFAWMGFGYWSLVNGVILGGAVATALTLCWRRYGFAVPNLANIYRELRFSGHVTVSGVGWYVYSNADFLVAGRVLGEAPLGDYTVAWTISSAPIEKIGNLLTGVTPAFFSAVQNSKSELRRYFLRLSEALAYVTVPASIGIVLVADYLVPVLLGPNWSGVVGPLRWLGILVAFRSLTTMLPKLLTALNETKFVMWTTVISAIVMPFGFFIGSRWGTKGIAIAWIVIYPPIMLPLYYRIFRRIETNVREYLSAVMPAVGASTIMTVALLLLRSTLPRDWSLTARFVLLIAAGTLCYASALFALYRRRMAQLFRAVRRMRNEQMQPEQMESDNPPSAIVGARLD
jgi:O-antigen/teichoic acid export membrane protein